MQQSREKEFYKLFILKKPSIQLINFIENNPDLIDKSLDSSNSLALHMACKYEGYFDLIIHLLNKRPDLINVQDKFGQTPLFWAAIEGFFRIVKYLLNCNADYTIFSVHHHDAFDYALFAKNLETIKVFLYKGIQDGNLDHFFNKIQSTKLALEIMYDDPILRKPLFEHPHMNFLIQKKKKPLIIDRAGNIHWYQTSGFTRRESTYTIINSKIATRFESQECIGDGTYGVVNLFSNEVDNSLAIKRLKESVFTDNKELIDLEKRISQRELRFYQRYYGAAYLFKLFEFYEEALPFRYYDNRLVMPYFEGLRSDKYFRQLNNALEIAKTVREVLKAVEKLHDFKIVHRDLKSNNILIHKKKNQIQVYLIDFGLSAYCFEKEYILSFYGLQANDIYPPELFTSKGLVPHPKQDLYTLGYNLSQKKYGFFNEHPQADTVYQLFPSIPKYSEKFQDPKPKNRASLASFFKKLNKEISKSGSLAIKPII